MLSASNETARDAGKGRTVKMWSLKFGRVDWVALLGVSLVTGMLIFLSILRYTGYTTGMLDLGNMAQAIWSGTQGLPLEFTHEYGNLSRLAMHVEVIYWLFVPLYALLPDPRTLLIVQALFFAAGAWPVYRLAMRHLGQRSLARVLVLCYLFYPVAQTSVLFDFHGDTLAMPLLLFALDALDRQAWRSYAVWIILALMCKFYVAFAVGALGAVLWLAGRRRAGGLTMLAAVAWLGITLGIIRPLLAPEQISQPEATLSGYFAVYFGRFGLALLRSAPGRAVAAFVVLFPALWLGRYAWRWLLPALAITAPALLTMGYVSAFQYQYHHYATAVPFLIVATLYGAAELRRRQEQAHTGQGRRQRPWRGELFLVLGIILILNVAFVDTPLNPGFWMGNPNMGIDQWKYGQIPRDRFKDRWLRQNVPARAPLAASEILAPHLTNRRTLYLVRYPADLTALGQAGHQDQMSYLMRHPEDLENVRLLGNVEHVQYVVADALFDLARPFGGGVMFDVPGIMVAMRHPEFELLAAQDGLLLFGRDAAPGEGLKQAVSLRAWDSQGPSPAFSFEDRIGLLNAQIEPVGERRVRLRYEWVALQSLDKLPPLFAVSRLEGVDHSRIVHLPTLAVHPTPSWQMGQIVEEEFEVVLSAGIPPGSYRLLTGWYDGENADAAATNASSRIGEEIHSGTVVVP